MYSCFCVSCIFKIRVVYLGNGASKLFVMIILGSSFSLAFLMPFMSILGHLRTYDYYEAVHVKILNCSSHNSSYIVIMANGMYVATVLG